MVSPQSTVSELNAISLQQVSFFLLNVGNLDFGIFLHLQSETLKEFYSDWLIRNPWFMACLIPPDFHWVVAWREQWNVFGFCQRQELHIFFVTDQIQAYIQSIYFHFTCLFTHIHTHTPYITQKWLVMWVRTSVIHRILFPHLPGSGGQYQPYSKSTVGSDEPFTFLCNARAYLGWSLCCCQSNEGQQLWWQISFDKLNDPKKKSLWLW